MNRACAAVNSCNLTAARGTSVQYAELSRRPNPTSGISASCANRLSVAFCLTTTQPRATQPASPTMARVRRLLSLASLALVLCHAPTPAAARRGLRQQTKGGAGGPACGGSRQACCCDIRDVENEGDRSCCPSKDLFCHVLTQQPPATSAHPPSPSACRCPRSAAADAPSQPCLAHAASHQQQGCRLRW